MFEANENISRILMQFGRRGDHGSSIFDTRETNLKWALKNDALCTINTQKECIFVFFSTAVVVTAASFIKTSK